MRLLGKESVKATAEYVSYVTQFASSVSQRFVSLELLRAVARLHLLICFVVSLSSNFPQWC